ncbi:tyrosine-type recombinase/integrase [Gordonia rubripertincta]|uniref:tyrosine-type recombinase/integrase n=1 Tax=Gordonia rubripertincta TaxID=36822 RepID=UPI003556D782
MPSGQLREAFEATHSPRDRLILALVAVHALGVKEMQQLSIDDIDLAGGTIAIARRSGRHTLTLDEAVHRLTQHWLDHRHRQLQAQRPTTGVRDGAPSAGGGVDSNDRTIDAADQCPVQATPRATCNRAGSKEAAILRREVETASGQQSPSKECADRAQRFALADHVRVLEWSTATQARFRPESASRAATVERGRQRRVP